MPWVYTITLAEPVGAGTIQKDWEENIPGNANVQSDHGGSLCQGRMGSLSPSETTPNTGR